MSAEGGQVAGRLVVEVESSTKGFAQALKRKIDAAAAGVKAEVGIDLDAKGLRDKVESAIKEAGAGVTVQVGIDLDAKTLKAKVEAAAKAAATSVKVTADTKEMVGEVKTAAAAAEKTSILVKLRTAGHLVADALVEKAKAQAAVKDGIEVPIKPQMSGLNLGRGGLGRKLRGAAMLGLVSLIEPIVGVIGQAVAGLTAMAAAADDALGTIAAIPIAVSAGVQAIVGMKVATQGMGDAIGLLAKKQQALASGTKLTAAEQDELNKSMKDLSPSARVAARSIVSLRGAWVSMRKNVQEALFAPIAKEIKPLAKAVLPLLERGLTNTAATIGRVAKATADWMQTDLFKSEFSQIGRQNNKTIAAGGTALLNFAKAFTTFQVAAGPFQARMNGVIRSFSEWVLATTRANAKDGGIAGFLDRAADKAGQLWNITKQIGGGLGGILTAATPTGNSLLTQFEGFVTRWNNWTHSLEGQNYLRDWFESARPGFVEFGRLINDTFKGMAKWAADPKLFKLLNKLRTEFGPALGNLLKNLSDDTSEGLINFLTELTRALGHLEPAVKPIEAVTSALTAMLHALNNLADAAPGISDKIAELLGAMYVLRTLKKIPIPKLPKTPAGGGGLGLTEVAAGTAAGAGAGAAATKALKSGAQAGTAAEAAASSGTKVVEAASKWGKFGSTLSTVAKNPLMKKAGWAGVLLSVADFAHTMTSAEDKGDGFLKSLQGIVGETSTTGRRLQMIRDAMAGNNAETDESNRKMRGLANTIIDTGKKWFDYGSALHSLPPAVRTKVETPGAIKTIRDVKDLATIYKLTPRQIQTVMKLEGFSLTQRRIVALGKQYTRLPRGVKTKVETPGAIKSLGDVLQLGRQYELTPKQLKTLMRVTGTEKAGGQVKKLRNEIERIRGKIAQMGERGSKAAKERIAQLKKQIDILKGKTVPVKENGAKPSAGSVAHLRQEINALRSKSVTVTTNRVTNIRINTVRRTFGSAAAAIVGGRPGSALGDILDGAGFRRFARGGFGDQANRHQPELAGSGPTRVWREPETKGEAYIPLANDDRRGRAKAILSRVAEMFGGEAVFARGGIESFARGGGRGGRRSGLSKFLAADFAKALKGSLSQILAAQKKLVNRLVAAGKSRTSAEALLRRMGPRLNRIERLASQRARVASRLNDARARVADLTAARTALKEGITASGKDLGSLSSIASKTGGYLSPTFLVKELTRRAGDAEKFRTTLAALKKSGLGRASYEQLTSLGFEEGLPLAQQLLKASPDDLKKITALQDQINKSATNLASDGSKAYYNAGISAGKGLVKGLQAQQKELNKVASNMAKYMVAALKKALKIRSPSRVLAGIGKNTVDGLALGLVKQQPQLSKRAQAIAAQLASDLTPAATHASNYSSMLAAPRSAGPLRQVGDGGTQAALINELTIHGTSAEETRDALDQTMFLLRKLRQGGVYASRTA